MNSRPRRFLTIVLPGLLCLILAGSLRAQTTFTYTGNPYPPYGCNAAPVCNGTVPFVYVKFTTSLSLSQLSSLPGYSTGAINLTPYVTSWTVTDGDLLNITQASSGAGFAVSLSMPGGTPVSWLVSAQGNSANGSDHEFACTTTVGNASYGGFPYCNGVLTGDFSQVFYNYPYSGVIYSSGIIYNSPENGARGTWTVTQADVNVNTNETITTIDSPFIVAMPPLLDDAEPVAYFSAGSLGFEGESGTLPITVSNIGGGNLLIPNSLLYGGAFSIGGNTCTPGASLGIIPSGASCIFFIRYAAPTSGAATGTFTLDDNAALSNLPSTKTGSPFAQSVPLSGTGSSTGPPSAPAVNVYASVNEAITVVDTPVVAATPPLVSNNAPVAYFSVGSLDFGGQSGTKSVAVSNIGQQSLSLAAVSSPASPFSISQIVCTGGSSSLPATLPSGASCILSISYVAPSSGSPAGTITFTDNADLSNLPSAASGANFTQSLSLSGSGTSAPPPPPDTNVSIAVNETITVVDTSVVAATPPLVSNNAPVAYFSVGGLDFGGQSGTNSVTVSNIGQQSLSLAAVSSPASPFSISQIVCTGGSSSLPATLPSGASCIVSIAYVAPSSGSPAGTITFTDNADLSNLASAASGANFTQSLSLSGSGTSAPPPPPDTNVSIAVNETITVVDTPVVAATPPLSTNPAPVAYFSVGSLDFGGQSGTNSVTVSNIGQQSLSIAAVSAPASPFSISQIVCTGGSSSLPATLPSGASCIVSISYVAPSSGSPAGTITFTDNADLSNLASAASGANFTQSLSLSGSGTSAPPPPPDTNVSVGVNETITVSDTVSLSVPDTTPPVVTVPANITVAATSAAGAVVTFSATATDLVDGTDPVTCTPPSGSIFPIGTTTVSCSATDKAGNTSTATFTVTVQSTAVPKITWKTPAAITYGKALSATQLDATSTVAGTFVYTPAVGTVLGPGAQTLSVTFTPANPAVYSSATVTVSLLVNQAPLTVKAANATMTYGDALPDLTYTATGFVNGDTAATALTGVPVLTTTATSQSPVGSYTITASAGTLAAANYTLIFKNGALTINQATLTAAATDASIVYGSPIPTPAYTLAGFVNGDTQETAVTGSPALSDTATTASTAGSYLIDISMGTLTSTNYKFAFKNGTLKITKATPSINWTTPAPIAYGTPLGATQQDATASVAGSFAYSPVAGTVLDVATHTLTATFTPTDTIDYATTKATVSLTVNQAAQAISFIPISSPVVYGVAPISLSATSSSGLAVKFSILSGPANVSASTLTITGAGTVIVEADQAGNTSYTAAPSVTQTVVVNQAMPSIALASSTSSIAIGKTVTFTATLTGSGVKPAGTVTFLDGTTVLGTGTVDGAGVAKYATSSLTLGPHNITANYGGDADYVTASSAEVSVTITSK